MAASTIMDGTAARSARWRFVAAICLGSFLLFLVQPMVARMALPRLGGAPAVWNSAMLVYQGLLLAGYAYAHWLGRFAPRRQATVHFTLFALAALTLPIGLSAAVPSATSNPFLWVPWLLLTSIGPVFFVISAQAPLLQRWFALTGSEDPYPLYAASNVGSFAGLLTYPLAMEPLLAIAEQRWLWSAGYVLLAAFVAWCALALPRRQRDVPGFAQFASTEPVNAKTVASWIILAAVPSGLILSTTLHLTTDIGAMPLLWVLPLSVYLLSFSIAFAANRRPVRWIAALAPAVLLLSAVSLSFGDPSLALLVGAVAVLNLLTISVTLHGQLFDRRPNPDRLTQFYLALSFGGFLGGAFCALIAPLIFDWTYEHLILLLAAAVLMRSPDPFAGRWPMIERWLPWGGIAVLLFLFLWGQGFLGFPASQHAGLAVLATFVLIGVLSVGRTLVFTACVAAAMIAAGGWERLLWSAEPGKMTRSYFGVYTVKPHANEARSLIHGTTLHGIQNLGSPERERMATSYYAPASGVGLAMAAASKLWPHSARIGVVGLGAGTLACYARPEQQWTIYEIDPAVVALAEDEARFTFLSRCLPRRSTVVGDARLTLEQAAPASADLLVIDAFSSDAIPIHLLTREAFAVYRRHLAPDGLLLVHVSNRYFNLRPVVSAAAADGGWTAALRSYEPSEEERGYNATQSVWVALSQSPATLRRLTLSRPGHWQPLEYPRGFPTWSDDHASVLPLLRW